MITCSSCRYFHLNHEDLPVYRCTGHHGLCISPFQPRQVQHEGSVRCAWWERREKPVVTTCDAVVVEHCRHLAVLLAGDEELIAEIERRGYVVACRQIMCGECGEMRSVSPQEAGREVVCEFCGEKIDTSIILVGGESHVSIAGAA
jgi:hypothetical protein